MGLWISTVPRPIAISKQTAQDDIVDRQVADMHVLLRLMSGNNARAALNELRASLARTIADSADKTGAVGRIP
jgi:hypothetical protein